MKDFLPILIGIIWLGYKYYQKNQKKMEEEQAKARAKNTYSESPTATPKAEEEVKSLDDFMTTFFGNQQAEILKTEELHTPQYETVEDNYSEVEAQSEFSKPIDTAEDWINPKNDSIENSNVRTHEKELIKEQPLLIKEEEADKEDIMKDFDIEKLIIYDAILNRPYS